MNDMKTKLVDFDLAKAKAGAKVVTKDGLIKIKYLKLNLMIII